MMNPFTGLAPLPSMEDTAPPRLQRSCMRLNQGSGSAGTPMLLEETQYIIAGAGELQMEDGSKHRVGPGSVFAIPTPVKHDLVNVGKENIAGGRASSRRQCSRKTSTT